MINTVFNNIAYKHFFKASIEWIRNDYVITDKSRHRKAFMAHGTDKVLFVFHTHISQMVFKF